ncbi:hypothetical protein EII12_05495 [Buchananella hordeovulneris]|uniref:hypothetical protein n=1 Tax=Buchananella hordeovulneris TaxID=52770 RepID=UPI000F5E7463|nr:hypothetical protein [Buchananella hordeovulneris]RRD52291.1 hypothetical protein EII12_05495 [Buchananella hordeovulneris]
MCDFDWERVTRQATDYLVRCVEQVAVEHPAERIYGAVFHTFYGDGDVMAWPPVSVGTYEGLDGAEPEWNGPDMPYYFEGDDADYAVCDQVVAHAAVPGNLNAWNAEYERYLACFPLAARRATERLRAAEVVGPEFVAVAIDEAEELVPPSLTPAELERHFPHLVARRREEARLAGLPPAERAAQLAPAVLGVRGRLAADWQTDMFRALGAQVVPLLTEVVAGRQAGERWKAAKLLAEINAPEEQALAALEDLLLDRKAREADRCWAAAASTRLAGLAPLLAHADVLPPAVLARGLAGPFSSFNRLGAHRDLDYRELEAALLAHPEWEEAVERELSSLYELASQEVPTAQAALASPVRLIRRHAWWALDWYQDCTGEQVCPADEPA